jgi:hypothetical protein
MTEYTQPMVLPLPLPKDVIVDFDGGDLTSDAGWLLLDQADRKVGLTAAMTGVLQDQRQAAKVSHSLQELVQARVLAIAAGYADANDMDTLRHDPALKVSTGRCPESGGALASQPTVSRFENSVTRQELYQAGLALARCVVAQLPATTKRVILDIDATDDPCHGQQEFEGFNRYYDSHCYMPLLMHVTDEEGHQWPLAALLRPGRTSPLAGVRCLLKRAVQLLRERWPAVEILVRGDSGFGSDKVLRCCDHLKVHYLFGVPTNQCLERLGHSTQELCQAAFEAATANAATANAATANAATANAAIDDCPRYGSFMYRAGTWPKERKTIIKVAMTQSKLNPRYVVTDLNEWGGTVLDDQALYELYCGRGDQENRIKELKLDLESGRTSCHRFWANQLRLLAHLAAHVLWTVVRVAASGTRWAKAQVSTLQLQVLKVAARVRETTRRVWLNLCTAYPYQEEWRLLQQRLQ